MLSCSTTTINKNVTHWTPILIMPNRRQLCISYFQVRWTSQFGKSISLKKGSLLLSVRKIIFLQYSSFSKSINKNYRPSLSYFRLNFAFIFKKKKAILTFYDLKKTRLKTKNNSFINLSPLPFCLTCPSPPHLPFFILLFHLHLKNPKTKATFRPTSYKKMKTKTTTSDFFTSIKFNQFLFFSLLCLLHPILILH